MCWNKLLVSFVLGCCVVLLFCPNGQTHAPTSSHHYPGSPKIWSMGSICSPFPSEQGAWARGYISPVAFAQERRSPLNEKLNSRVLSLT